MSDSPSRLLDAMAQANDLVRAGQLVGAVHTLEKVRAGAHATEVAYLQAVLWMETGDWGKALALQDEVLAVCPPRAVPILDRATCLIELGREAEAERLLAADAPELRDKFPRNVLLARIAARRGDAGRAADLLRGAFDAERRRFVQGFFARRLAAGGRP